jgi:hypothetical protein
VVEFTGDIARMAMRTLIDKHCGRNLLIKEGLTRKLRAMRVELVGESPAPLERLLAERVIVGWLHLSYLEADYAGQDSMALELAMHYQRSMTLAQRRYLSAIKMLVQVRKAMGLTFDVAQTADGLAARTAAPRLHRAANPPADGIPEPEPA